MIKEKKRRTTKVYAVRFPMLPLKRWNDFKKEMDKYAKKLKSELLTNK